MSALHAKPGTIYGVGLGPGNPDLMSVRADRLVRNAGIIAFFRKKGRPGHARTIVADIMPAGVTEFPMEYPITTEILVEDPMYAEVLRDFYDTIVEKLLEFSRAGSDVVVLCEGDPFFYGSFMHLHSRIANRAPVEVVPAVSGMSGCWTATGTPITYGDDVLSVLPATLPESDLVAHMQRADALVVMKIGRHLAKVRRALAQTGLLERAFYVERGTMPEQVVTRLADKPDEAAPYFSIILVHGQGRRP